MRRALLAAMRLQYQLTRRSPDDLLVLGSIPMLTIVFLSIMRFNGRHDLLAYAVMGPVLIALWGTTLFIAGEVVVNDRGYGVLEGVVAAPMPFQVLILGRVLAIVTIGLLGFAEAWFVARFLFDVSITLHHPALFIATLVLTTLTMCATGLLMAALFVLGRSARPFQRALTYPFYVLGGVVVPVTLLPEWVRPLSRIIFLSWSSDLLRASLAPADVTDPVARLVAIAGLGAVALAGGWFTLRKMLDRVRRIGTMTYV